MPGEAHQLGAAFAIARTDFEWNGVEKECGVYNFTVFDNLLATLSAEGVQPMWIFGYQNPCYDGGLSPFTDAGRQGFVNFTRAAVQHFLNRGVLWEIWNEPDGPAFWHPTPSAANYTQLAIAVSDMMTAEFPGEWVQGPTVSWLNVPYLTTCFKDNLLQHIPHFSWHPYRSAAMSPESVLEDLGTLRALMAQFIGGPAAQSMTQTSSEWGFSSCGSDTGICPTDSYGRNVTRRSQAAFLPRSFLSNTMGGVGVSVWYDFLDDGTSPSTEEENYGTLTSRYVNASVGYAPKLSYLSALALQTLMGDALFAERVPPSSIQPGDPKHPTPASSEAFIALFTEGEMELPSFAVWTNVSSCSLPSTRVDCGFSGISEEACVRRGCCWDGPQTVKGLPQCYAIPSPANVTFRATPAAQPRMCLSAFDFLGQPAPQYDACVGINGMLTAPLLDAPVYLTL